MSTVARIGLVGAGYWGKNLARNFHQLGALGAVCDAHAPTLAACRKQYPDATMYADVAALLADASLPAVALAAPAEAHGRLVCAALEAGKDVYVEKPLCLSLAEGRELVALAAARGRLLMVGHLLWYHPAILKLKELVDAGTLGRLLYIYSTRVNLGKIRREENILWSFAPHDISVILGLVGEMPDGVNSYGGFYLHQQIADLTVSLLSFASGVKAHIFVSWLHPFKEQKLVVVGDRQMAVFDDTVPQDKLVLYPHVIGWKGQVPDVQKAAGQPVLLEAYEPLRAECEHFLDCVRTRRQPRTDGQEGLRVLTVLDQCQRTLGRSWAAAPAPAVAPVPPPAPTPAVAAAPAAPAKPYFVHPTAIVDEPCSIGAGTKIWHFCHIMKNALIGQRCNFGQNCNVDSGVVIGDNVKVQNNVSLYTGVVAEDDVFLGPSCVITNVTNPRSQISRHGLYETTIFRRGCTVGANATICCGVEIGAYAFIGAGAVVTKSVPAYGLVVGNPARRVGWISRHGLPLKHPDAAGVYTCPESGLHYRETAPGVLRCLDLAEDAPLPDPLRQGTKRYDDLVHGGHLTREGVVKADAHAAADLKG